MEDCQGSRQVIPVGGDGKTWKELPNATPIPSWDEFNVSFDDVGKRFIATVKDSGSAGGYGGAGRYGRSVWLSTSKDFRQWSRPELVFETDDEDQRIAREVIKSRFKDPRLRHPQSDDPAKYNADVYNMGLFQYEGLYIGLPTVYYATGPEPGGRNTDGFHVVQLACSRDLKNWKRLGDRQAFIGPSPIGAGAYDLTQIICPSSPVVRDDELWFYYTGLKYRLTPERSDSDTSAICLAVLRRDGFISLDAGATEGSVLTRPFALPKGDLHVNVDAGKGCAVVQVCDGKGAGIPGFEASKPINGNPRDAIVAWPNASLEALAGKTVCLRITLREAKLYSYWIVPQRQDN